MNRLGKLEGNNIPPKPCDYFDVIAGTGTGGVIACMLGRLKMSIDQAIESYGILVKVFSDSKSISTSGPSAYKGSKLQEALQAIIHSAGGNKNERMLEGVKESRCKTIVFAMSKHNMNAGIPTMFRSYSASENPGPNCTIWEALYATMAHPDLFKSIDIGEYPLKQSFVGGELGCSNPMAHVLSEVKRTHPNGHVSCVLSVGAGHARTIQMPEPSLTQRVLRVEEVVIMKDMAVDSERVAEEMAARFQGTNNFYFRFSVDQGMQSVNVDAWEKLSEVVAHARAYTNKVEVNKRMSQAVNAIKERKAHLTAEYIDGQVQLPTGAANSIIGVKRCPAPLAMFTGRGDDINYVGSCIVQAEGTHERRVAIIHGLGGAGKTQLALKTIEKNRDRWTYVLYVDASSRETVEAALSNFAKAMNAGTTYEDGLAWLEFHREHWLLAFDNADLPELDIHKYFPGGNHGSILVTTRLINLKAHGRGPNSDCAVSSMRHEEALALLLRTARIHAQELPESEVQAAGALLQDIGYLALAITHAGAYIGASPDITISEYRELLHNRGPRILEQYTALDVKLDDYGKTVNTTWQLCYDLLEPYEDSRRLLWLFAYLHHDDVPHNILQLAATNMNEFKPPFPRSDIEISAYNYVQSFLVSFTTPSGGWDSLAFSNIVNKLTACSLVTYDGINRTYKVHVLVQDWARAIIPQPRELAIECTTTLLSLAVNQIGDIKTYESRRRLGTHLVEIQSHQPNGIGSNHAESFARVFHAQAQWSLEAPLRIQAKETCELVYGEEHSQTQARLNLLADVYWQLGQEDAGELLWQKVLDIRRRAYGEEHRLTLESVGHLAFVYSSRGQWKEAEPLQVKVLNGHQQLLGDRHASTLISMEYLGKTYYQMDRYLDAESLQVQALTGYKDLLGDQHQNTLNTQYDLAKTYWMLGLRQEAQSLWLQTLNAMKQVIGSEHPKTLICTGMLAFTYFSRNQLVEAEQLQVQLVDTQERVLGKDNLNTIVSKEYLAKIYQRQGRWEEAEALQKAVLRVRRDRLGEEHPQTQAIIEAITSTYRHLGRFDSIENLKRNTTTFPHPAENANFTASTPLSVPPTGFQSPVHELSSSGGSISYSAELQPPRPRKRDALKSMAKSITSAFRRI